MLHKSTQDKDMKEHKEGEIVYKFAELTQKAVNDKRFLVCFSSDKIDRDGDVIVQKWVIRERKGGRLPLLSEHSRKDVIGFIDLATMRKVVENGVEFSTVEIEFDELTELSKVRKAQFEAFTLGLSVGFFPKDFSWEEKLRDGQDGMSIYEAELLEISVVSIPSNADAQRKSKNTETNEYLLKINKLTNDLESANFLAKINKLTNDLQTNLTGV